MPKGKHRTPSILETAVSNSGGFAAVGSAMAVLLATPVVFPAVAEAASTSDTGILDEIARCESSGNSRIVNSSGHGGLFQFDAATWKSVGGTGRPEAASVSEQYKRASLLLASRGTQPWLASQGCWGRKFNPVKAGTRVTVTSKTRIVTPVPTPKTELKIKKPSPKPRVKVVPEKVVAKAGVAAAGSYTVKSGDTLSEIAVAKHTTWRSLYLANQNKITDPDLIFPDQVLVTK